MAPEDLRLFCTALGFTVVVMRGDSHSKNGNASALGFARLIESFCQLHHPGMAANQDTPQDMARMIEEIKTDLRDKGEADMDKDRDTLLNLYDHLRYRYGAYATNDAIADRVLELLDAEINHEDSLASKN